MNVQVGGLDATVERCAKIILEGFHVNAEMVMNSTGELIPVKELICVRAIHVNSIATITTIHIDALAREDIDFLTTNTRVKMLTSAMKANIDVERQLASMK